MQLSPAVSVRMKRLPHRSNTILSSSPSSSRSSRSSRFSNSLRLRHCHSPPRCTRLNHRLHLRLLPILFLSNILCYQLTFWFRLFSNHQRILTLHPCPRVRYHPKGHIRGQRVLWTSSPREKWLVTILQDPADPQPVPTENTAPRETQRCGGKRGV